MRSALAYRKHLLRRAVSPKRAIGIRAWKRPPVVPASGFLIRSALAYRKRGLLRAVRCENGALHTQPPFAMEAHTLRARQRVSMRPALVSHSGVFALPRWIALSS
jgi:hypothetical protein